ncbi:MAG: glycosyl hydrolase-related protein [Arcanobacterium sp.]|nr:glycosyl hydrolase-related protein [Arcanobacterium sp.]
MEAKLIIARVERMLRERIRPAQHTSYSQLRTSIWKVPDEAVPHGAETALHGAEATPATPHEATPTTPHLGAVRTVVGEPVPPHAVPDPEHFTPIAVGTPWGKPWQTVWFIFEGTTPEATAVPTGDTLEALIDLGWADHSAGFQCEGLVRGPDGHTIKALNPRNTWVPLPQAPESPVHFTVEAAANPLLLAVPPFQKTYDGDKLTASQENLYVLRRADIVIRHTAVCDLATDIAVLLELLSTRDSANFTNDDYEVLYALNSALDALDLSDIPGTASAARELLAPIMARPALPGAHRLSAVGHAHIDSAWLWPLRETKRKVNRTLANVCRLIEDGTGLVFALPAAQHVAWLRETDPELFERVATHVKNGAIVPVGGMWVEPDAVLPGSEAFARQLVEGTRFFAEAFGYECTEIWLPDSFGYSAALPQLAREAGISRFLTQKISWNQTNVFPYHTLLWEGIDGSRIFTHFPPADTYGSEVTGDQIMHAVTNFKNKGTANCSLLPFGYGDGGGGPTREMMDRISRLENLRGAPRVVSESPHDFFDRAEVELPNPPVWVGELYLELHRGTLTSQIRAKQGNRRSEALLRETELWCTIAALSGAPYPYDELREAWHTVLLCQFHDILPGTSVAWVYREVAQLYAHVKATCEALIANAFDFLATHAEPTSVPQAAAGNASAPAPLLSPQSERSQHAEHFQSPEYAQSESTPQFLANATSFSRHGVAPLSAAACNSPVAAAPEASPQRPENGVSATAASISNGLLTLDFTADGALTQLTDAGGHTYVPAGVRGGEFQVFQDFPNMWDAWDIDPFYSGSLSTPELHLDATGTRDTPDGQEAFARASMEYGASHATIEWALQAGSPSVDVHVSANWHEHEKLLKLTFPVDIHTDHAQYETQFGYIERPTHTNTSWEQAKFEVSAHRWIRLANAGTSWAIANDSTYGWDITRHSAGRRGTWSQVRATLVKSAVYPDPEQDQGHFEWNFRIHPGAGVLDALADGQQLNLPLRPSPVAIAAPLSVAGAVVESVALAPDRSGDVVVRLYEALGAPTTVELTMPGAYVRTTDLLYRESSTSPRVHSSGATHRFTLAPFQIATVRITPNYEEQL